MPVTPISPEHYAELQRLDRWIDHCEREGIRIKRLILPTALRSCWVSPERVKGRDHIWDECYYRDYPVTFRDPFAVVAGEPAPKDAFCAICGASIPPRLGEGACALGCIPHVPRAAEAQVASATARPEPPNQPTPAPHYRGWHYNTALCAWEFHIGGKIVAWEAGSSLNPPAYWVYPSPRP